MSKRGFENSILLLKSLKNKSPQSKEDLFRQTKIAKQHIKKYLDRLYEKGFIEIKKAKKGFKKDVSIKSNKMLEIEILLNFFD